MKRILFILIAMIIAPAANASVTCVGTGKTGANIQYILSDIKGKIISIEYFVSSRGKMVPIIKNTATLVAEGRAMFGGDKVIERSYILPDNDNSYAILFLIYADGTAGFTARPMEGTANFVEAKCK